MHVPNICCSDQPSHAPQSWPLRCHPSAQGPSKEEPRFFNRTDEQRAFEEMCAKAPTAILAVLGPRSCGKTALLKEVLGDKPYSVYINCRGISTSTPASFVEALLTSVLPKAPLSVQEMVMTSLRTLAGGLAAKVSMASDAKEEFTFNPAELGKLLAGVHSNKPPGAGMNALFDALRCAMVDYW
jgi:ABC-type cobalamin/Fe3+-siderophores transport system ATPase subunit